MEQADEKKWIGLSLSIYSKLFIIDFFFYIEMTLIYYKYFTCPIVLSDLMWYNSLHGFIICST